MEMIKQRKEKLGRNNADMSRLKLIILIVACLMLSVSFLGCGEKITVKLELKANREGDGLVISGTTTNLPNGTLLAYEIRKDYGDELMPAEPYFVDGTVTVENGRYEKRITGVPSGKISVWVAFQTILGTDVGQPQGVLEKFGKMGEKLTGENVIESGNIKRVEKEVFVE